MVWNSICLYTHFHFFNNIFFEVLLVLFENFEAKKGRNSFEYRISLLITCLGILFCIFIPVKHFNLFKSWWNHCTLVYIHNWLPHVGIARYFSLVQSPNLVFSPFFLHLDEISAKYVKVFLDQVLDFSDPIWKLVFLVMFEDP